MLRSVRTPASSPVCQSDDKPQAKKQAKKKVTTTVPASWKLTQQQQAFIDSFAESPEKKDKLAD